MVERAKLSEKLRELAQESMDAWLSRVGEAYDAAAKLAEAYEAEQERRIAELTLERDALRESIQQPATCDMRKPYEELNADYIVMVERARQEARKAEKAERRIAELESQLAWTPVADGLPTEPGLYVFVSRGEESLFTVADGGKLLQHVDNGTDPWDATAMSYWTNYRRIELPEAK